MYLGFNGYSRCRADSCLTEREACECSPVHRLTERRVSCPRVRRLTGKRASCMLRRLTGKRALWFPWPPALLTSSTLMAPKLQFNMVFKYKTLIANVLVRTPVCKPDSFPRKPRENVPSRMSPSLQRKRLFWMTHVQPRTNNLVRIASVILGMLSFVKLERLTFVDLVTLPFVNPYNTAICQNMQLKITSTIYFLQLKFSN